MRNPSHSVEWTVGDTVLELGERTGLEGRDVSSFSREVLGGSRRMVEFQ